MRYEYGVRVASVWVQNIQQWVPLTQVTILERYTHDGKLCAQFKFEEEILESYIEYKQL